jgi:hypothetical protein
MLTSSVFSLFSELLYMISQLFHDFDRVITRLRGVGSSPADLDERALLTERLKGACAAIRASIDTHVRSEEVGLWPLFAEHFTPGEQEQVRGRGRGGKKSDGRA